MDHRSILLALALVMCLTMLQHPASEKSSNDTEWLTPLNVTLHWGEQFEISGYRSLHRISQHRNRRYTDDWDAQGRAILHVYGVVLARTIVAFPI